MKRYPEYKPVNSPGLEEIPEGWSFVRLTHLGEFSSSGIDKKSDPDEVPVRMVNYTDVYGNPSRVINSQRPLMEVTCPASKAEEYELRKGDLVFTPSSETPEDIGLSALIDEDLTGTVFSYHVTRFRFTCDVHHPFKKYLCNNAHALNQFSALCKGTTRKILTRDHFNSVWVVLPSLEEQRAIATFLDQKTAQIDTLIQKKGALIDLLREQRTALINRAVTKGLDPDVPMKDSGIEWLGEVPEHWTLVQLRYVAGLQSGTGITSEDIAPDGEYPVYGGNGVRGYTSHYTHEGYYALIGRQGALCGNVNYASGKFWASEHAVVVTPFGRNRTGWLGGLLDAMKLGQYSVAAAQPGLAVDRIKALRIPVPPPNEQVEIESYINEKTAQIDSVVSREEHLIQHLREFRASLISEVITGKLDVRNSGRVTEEGSGEGVAA